MKRQTPDGSPAAQPPLCVAVTAGHAGIVRILCEAGASINAACIHSGETALHHAVKAGRDDILDILLRFEPDLNARTLPTHETPLHYAAAKSGSTAAVAALLKHGANYESLNGQGCSPADVALQAQDLDRAIHIIRAAGSKSHKLAKGKKLLLDQILDSRRRSSLNKDLVAEALRLACPSDSTALVEAIKTRDASLVKLVLERGSNPNEATASGLYPIFAGFDACSAPVVQALVEYGADVTLRNPHGPNVLQAALASPLSRDKEAITSVFELLLSWGADASTTYSDGRTMLHRTVSQDLGLVRIVHLLLKHGVSIDAQDQNGYTALHVAAASPPCVALLLKHGANPNTINAKGLTPLLDGLRSATSDNEPDFRELIKASDRGTVDPAGRTSLHFAAQNGLTKTVKSLLEARADTSLTDTKKRTPLLLAVSNHQWANVALLATQPGNNSWDDNGLTALHHIAISTPKAPSTWKHIAAAAAPFCEKGVSRSMRDQTGSTPLIQAAKTLPEEGLPILEVLLSQKGSERSNCVAHEDHDQRNALYYAATSSKVTFVEVLLRYGSPFTLSEWRGKKGPVKPDSAANKRILNLFAEHEWIRRMGRLHRQFSTANDEDLLPKMLPIRDLKDMLTMGLDPNRLPSGKLPGSLLWALLDYSISLPSFPSSYDHDALKLVFAFGADPNAMTSRKPPRASTVRNSHQTPMSVHPLTHILEQCPRVSLGLVKLLLDNGAKLSVASLLYDGRYPLHSAVRASCPVIVDEMLRRKPFVDCSDDKQRTPLFIAAEDGLVEIADLLLRSGARATAVDVEGNTPLHVAAATGSTQVLTCLLRAGAKATCENSKGLTPLRCLSDHLPDEEKRKITVLMEQAQELERRKLAPPAVNSRGRMKGPGLEKPAVNEGRKVLRKPRNVPAQPSTTVTNAPSARTPIVVPPTITNLNPPQVPTKDTPAPLRFSIRYTPPTPPTLPSTVAPPKPSPVPNDGVQQPRHAPRVDSGLDLSKAGKERSPPVLERNKATFDSLGDSPTEEDELKSWLSMSKMLDRL
ncbi:uncharacterized protein N0V89_002933 [Didymosphaeria variabile]|uniref:Ankyrin n=1 Tax=Didymosphaeria variabile TaxID=1932322 RepID=A0A9W8XT09_9PLEO|nr:uncharacterized protein N0V89_002933 [Didymosphaeria variabile]KAJ4358351.1 hypothetical protein N0V89_002933 [Didymosphaeria variabile]